MIYVNGHEMKLNQFPDGTLLTKADFPVDDLPEDGVMINWHYENDAELFALICFKRHLDQYYSSGIDLFMPYIPHARMDRVKATEDVFTLKYFCEVINSLNFDTVYVRDAHSNVSLALLNNVKELSIIDYVSDAQKDCGATVAFFPDEGAMKRYSSMFNMPYAFGMKKRDWVTGVIQGLDIINAEVVKDKDILIVDDICSRGGTFFHSAKALKAAGANKIYLYVTHLEHTVFEGELITGDLIDHIYTTNSLCENYHNEKITVIE